EQRPAQVELVPGVIGQFDLRAEQAPHEVAAEQARAQQRPAEQPVQHGGLPLDEDVAVQPQGGAAEDDDDRQVDPVRGLDVLAGDAQPYELGDRGGDGHRRGGIDVGEPVGDEEQDQREEVEQEFLHSVFERFEFERQRVDAVAQPGGLGAGGEDVAEVGVADIAQHFGADHAVRGVAFFAHPGRIDGFEIAGPAAAGIELGVGGEQGGAAAHAAVYAVGGGVPVTAGEGAFGAFLAHHGVFFGRELGAPFGVGFAYFFHMHSWSPVPRNGSGIIRPHVNRV